MRPVKDTLNVSGTFHMGPLNILGPDLAIQETIVYLMVPKHHIEVKNKIKSATSR